MIRTEVDRQLSCLVPQLIDFYNSPAEKRQNTFMGVEKSKQIVVYCQSDGCSYDEKLAKVLIADGYKNIQFLRGGWLEWKQAVKEK